MTITRSERLARIEAEEELFCCDTEDEGSFSWSPCILCKEHLGGMRYKYVTKSGNKLNICAACMYEIEIGQDQE